MSNHKFSRCMILYSKSEARTNIYNTIKDTTEPRLNKFEAIDTINNWNEWCKFALQKNLTTREYISKIGGIYGKLGCNLSHQLLIEHVYYHMTDVNWLMVMEDDIKLHDYSADLVDKLIDKADQENSHYIQLFVNKNHKIHQSRSQLVDKELKLYKMIPQWGTVCYLIDRVGMKKVIDSFPVNENMDYLYNSLIEPLNSFCYLGNMFDTCGTMDSQDNSAPLGSLIWGKDVIDKIIGGDKYNAIKKKNALTFLEVKFNDIANKIYIFPSYLSDYLKETINETKYTIIKESNMENYKNNSTVNSDDKYCFVSLRPHVYMLLNFIQTVANDRENNSLRYVIPQTQQLHLGKWMNDNKIMSQYDIIKQTNCNESIDLDNLIYQINTESITNISTIGFYIKKLDPRSPSLEQVRNHEVIKRYINDKYPKDTTYFGYNETDNVTNAEYINKINEEAKYALEMAEYIDDDPNNHIYQSLWIGNKLSNMEKLSIKSFIDNGHIYHLYTYGEIEGIPEGTIVKDGNEILDKSEIFTYKNGSYSAFSNLFRFTLLYKKGGYWVDTDFVCIKPMYFDHKYAIASEPNENYTEQLVTSCLLKLPKGSKEALEGINIQMKHKEKILSGEITWSSGPKSVKDIVDKFDLHKFVIDWRLICSCFCHHSRSLIDEGFIVNNITGLGDSNRLNNMLGVHLWHECWRRNNMSKDGDYSVNSVYGSLCERFLTTDIRKIENKIKVVFVVNRKTYLTKMARERFHTAHTFLKMINTELIYTGIGWDNYNTDLDIHQNLENLRKEYSWNTIDYVMAYKPLEVPKYSEIKYPKVIRYNEMYDVDWTLKEIMESGSDIVICHHLNDYEKFDKMNLVKANSLEPIKFYYIGHCAEAAIYKDWGFRNNKQYDLMLVGCLLESHYPLRNRFKRLLPIMEKKGYRVHIHPHPGYDLHDAYTSKYQIEFAQILNRTRIALTDTGIPRSRYGKYVEIPACATLLAGDLPGDMEYKDHKPDKFKNFVINISMDMTDDMIINKLEQYLDNENKIQYETCIENGLEFAENYRQENYCDNMYQILMRNKKT